MERTWIREGEQANNTVQNKNRLAGYGSQTGNKLYDHTYFFSPQNLFLLISFCFTCGLLSAEQSTVGVECGIIG